MEIKLKLGHPKTATQLKALLLKKLKRSRFQVSQYNVEAHDEGPVIKWKVPTGEIVKYGRLRIYGIRLRVNKAYHGPGPSPRPAMQRRGWQPGRRVAKMSFLEGADWIEWNDLLNDFCDENGICADIFSAVCVIRRGWFRRICYDFKENGNWLRWERYPPKAHFLAVDSPVGLFPASDFPGACPTGIYRNLYACWSDRNDGISDEVLLTEGLVLKSPK